MFRGEWGTCNGCNLHKWIVIRSKYLCQSCNDQRKGKSPISLKKSPIKKRSAKKEKEDREYTKLRKEFLELHPACQIRIHECTHKATEIHHTQYRGIRYLDISTWVSACHNCHEWCHSNPQQARQLGYLK
jgi:hypothetical protein